jgi:hypothetical protein
VGEWEKEHIIARERGVGDSVGEGGLEEEAHPYYPALRVKVLDLPVNYIYNPPIESIHRHLLTCYPSLFSSHSPFSNKEEKRWGGTLTTSSFFAAGMGGDRESGRDSEWGRGPLGSEGELQRATTTDFHRTRKWNQVE